MSSLTDSLEAQWEAIVRLGPRLLTAAVVMTLAVILGRVLARGVEEILERGRLRPKQRDFFRRVIVWAVSLFGVAVALNVLGLKAAATGLLAGGGITAVILGFAFREIGENLLAGFFLAFSSPFKVGDIIQSGEFKGTVRGIDMRQTHVRSSDGRDIFLPNAQIFNTPLINFTRDGLLRPAFTLGIDYADDAREACRLLLEEVRAVESVVEDPKPSVTIAGLESSFVLLEVGFWVDTFRPGVTVGEVRTEVMDRCRRKLREAAFTISSDVSTSVTLTGREPLDVRLDSTKSS